MTDEAHWEMMYKVDSSTNRMDRLACIASISILQVSFWIPSTLLEGNVQRNLQAPKIMKAKINSKPLSPILLIANPKEQNWEWLAEDCSSSIYIFVYSKQDHPDFQRALQAPRSMTA
jgi:hypothetical protein